MKSTCASTWAATNTVEDLNNLLASKEFCKVAYKMLIKQIASIPHKSQSKWLSDCNSQSVDYIDWHSSYGLAFLCTHESKLRTFQCKFLHRRMTTNSYLFKIGIASDNLCSFCKERNETILHLFWECTFVQAFWNEIKQWMSKRPCFPNDVFSFQSCLGFVDNTSNILSHHFLLICRYHIHWSKLMSLFPSLALCIQNFLTCLEVERCYAFQNGNLQKFNVKPLYVKTISDILFLFKVWGEQQQWIYEITFFNLFGQLSELVLRKIYFNVRPLKVNKCFLRVYVYKCVCVWVPKE